jgi:hypothetical protein
MTMETYKEAAQLTKDIDAMDKRIKDVEEWKAHITISSDFHYQHDFSSEFEIEILEWLKTKREEYQKKFDELK